MNIDEIQKKLDSLTEAEILEIGEKFWSKAVFLSKREVAAIVIGAGMKLESSETIANPVGVWADEAVERADALLAALAKPKEAPSAPKE